MNQASDKTAKLQRLRQIIRARKGLIACGRGFSVALHQCGRLLYAGTDRLGQRDAETWEGIDAVVAEGDSVVALLRDGTVRAVGRSERETAFADNLTCVRRVEIADGHLAVLLSNGCVAIRGRVARGHASRIKEDAAEWPAVTDICCGATYLAGLTEEGRVVVAGGSRVMRYLAGGWRDVVGIFADSASETLYAIDVSGRLLCTSTLPGNAHKWRNLVFMAVHGHRLLAITAGGELLSTMPLSDPMRERERYVACSVSATHSLALSWDGVVVAEGRDGVCPCDTTGFARLFDNFEEYGIRRREKEVLTEAAERAYQHRRTECQRFANHLACSPRMTVCLTSQGRVLTTAGFGAAAAWTGIRSLACGNAHILALGKDGRVFADGNNVGDCCSLSDWENVRAIAAGSYHSIGLTADGRVLYRGLNDKGQGDVTDWSEIRYLRTADAYTVGVNYDGEIRLAGMPPFDPACVIDMPLRPVDVAVASTHMVSLYANGHVCSTMVNDGTDAWRNMRAVSVGRGFTVGLCYGGTVRLSVTAESDLGEEDRRAVSGWRQVVSVTCGDGCIAALTADGRVLTAGSFSRVRMTDTEQMSTHGSTPAPVVAALSAAATWRDVIAVTCSSAHLIALDRKGHIHASGADSDGQCSGTAHFSLFRDSKYLLGNRPVSSDELHEEI